MLTSLILAGLTMATPSPQDGSLSRCKPAETGFYSFKVKDIDGKDFAFKSLRGKVVMVLNTASKCGLTPQYSGLEDLYKKYKSKGFVIIGFPANSFKNQEPAPEAEIKAFCTQTYGITFPMMSKISVNGPDKHPLFDWLIKHSDRPEDEIEWNFTKFLVDKQGKVRYRFMPREEPNSGFIGKAIETLLSDGATKPETAKTSPSKP